MEPEKITQKPVRRNLLQELDESEVTPKPNLRSFLKRTQSRYTPLDIFESGGEKNIESDKSENATNKVSNRKRCMELANDLIELSSEDEEKTPIQKIRKVDSSKSSTPPTQFKRSKVDFDNSGVRINKIQEYITLKSLNNGLGTTSPQVDESVGHSSKSATTENKDDNEITGNQSVSLNIKAKQEIEQLIEKLEQDLSEMKKTIEKMKAIYKK
jgi:hypothetical protein